jgi:hypothetical protein
MDLRGGSRIGEDLKYKTRVSGAQDGHGFDRGKWKGSDTEGGSLRRSVTETIQKWTFAEVRELAKI